MEGKEKVESDIKKAKIRKKEFNKNFTKGSLVPNPFKIEARLRKLISAHNLAVSSYEHDPMLEEKYQTLKQNMYNEIATCEVMLEPATGQSSEHDEMGEEIEKPLDLKVIPSMDPIEREFRERLDSMERDDEVPTYIDPETISERDFYLLIKDVELYQILNN